MKRRFMALLLAITMVTTMIQIDITNVSADTEATIVAEEVWAAAGSTVEMNIDVANNPGILGATITVSWEDGLTLIDAENGSVFECLTYQKPSRYTNTGTNFMWYGSEVEEVLDGTILTLTFDVSEEIEEAKDLPVTVNCSGVYDNNQNAVSINVISGCVKIVNYLPGDVSGNDLIDALDLIMLARYISDGCTTDPDGYNVTINESAADVNDDGNMDPLDLIMISRYISDGCVTDPNGYNIILKPSTPKCKHSMIATEAVDATCTTDGKEAYWTCEKCDKHFSDEAGKNEISLEDTVIVASHKLTHVEAKAASYTEEGCNEHWKCSACDKYFANSLGTEEISEEDVIIPIIERIESTVVYNVTGSDPYLESVGVDNSSNKTVFYSEDGLVLNDLVAPAGYVFKGWTTASGEAITKIEPSSSSRQIVVNAVWEKTTYRVTFDTPDVSVTGSKITGETVTNYTEYTVDTGVTLTNPKSYGYTFVGWSDDNGFLVNSIKAGTTGNMTLHANWTSNRNRATSYSDYDDPIIIEDDNNGQFLFVYDIGKIDNVPLYDYLGEDGKPIIDIHGGALEVDQEYTYKEELNMTQVEAVIDTVANATTRSSGWTLSEEWNDLYEEGSEYTDKQIKSEERTDSQGNVVGGNYFVSNSQGGSSFVSTESGGSSSNSSKVTTENSNGINTSYDKLEEKYCEATLGVKNETELSAGFEVPVSIGKASVGVKNTTTVSAETTSGRKENEAFHVDTNSSSYVGTVNTSDSSSYFNTVANQSSNWNSTTGYEKSYQTSIESTVSQAIASEIAKTTNYNISKSLGGGSEHNTAISGSTTTEKGYSNSMQVAEYYSKTTTKKIKYSNAEVGHYRLVMAGTVHVYGVVGYDVATASYYTYTYNVLADDTFEYIDYSMDSSTFDDCENGVVTFEIPYEVNEYILAVTSETEGLEIGLDGTVNKFETPVYAPVYDEQGNEISPAKEFDGTVVVPQYYAETSPGTDNIAIKTKAISSTAFQNNQDIKTVILPIYVTEIPENAFAGCTNLETVIAYGVTKIGANAFKDCTSLKKFYIDNYITELGTNAFENVTEIAVMAANSSAADAAIASGAKNITVDISKITDSYDNKTVVVGDTTESFAIIGNGGEYNNLQINSNAKSTLVSKIKFVNNVDIPLKLNSPTVTLSVVAVEDSPVYALQLGAEQTDLKLYGEINLNSLSENTVISKNVTLSKANTSITSKLNLSGKYLVCGEVVNKEDYLNVEPTSITSDEYDVFISPCVVSFDANGGEEITSTKIVYSGQKYGELPIPVREYYEFTGWYTEAEGGELITAESDIEAEVSQTLYAGWKALTATLVFDANGGTVDEENKIVYIGEAVGELPIPTRENCIFNGWHTEDGTLVTEESVFTLSEDIALKAYWQSDWVLASEIPGDGVVSEEKWTYDLTTNIESDQSEVAGYTLYETTSEWSEYGSWSEWSDTYVAASDSRQVETRTVIASTNYKTVYHYHRWAAQYYGGESGYGGASGSMTNYYTYDTESELTYWQTVAGYNVYKYYYNGSWFPVYGSSPYTTQEVASYNYKTQYRYRDRTLIYTYYHTKTEALESATEIVETDNISNVQKWVKYFVK